MSLLGVLQVIFLVLKLAGIVAWGWAVVLIPLWIIIGLIVLQVVFGAAIFGASIRGLRKFNDM